MNRRVQEWQPATSVPELGDGAVQVWWAGPADARPGHDRLLTPDELVRRAGMRQLDDRNRFTVAYALTRLVVASQLGVPPAGLRFVRTCRRCGGPHGKPHLVGDAALRFSISHSGARVAVAVARDADVGADVEHLDRRLNVDSMVRQVLSRAEAAAVAGLAPADRFRAFLTYWTRKEAVLKATGDGLSEPLSGLTVTEPHQAPRLLSWAGRPGAAAGFHLRDLHPGAEHLAAVALAGPPPTAVTELDGRALLAGHSTVRSRASDTT